MYCKTTTLRALTCALILLWLPFLANAAVLGRADASLAIRRGFGEDSGISAISPHTFARTPSAIADIGTRDEGTVKIILAAIAGNTAAVGTLCRYAGISIPCVTVAVLNVVGNFFVIYKAFNMNRRAAHPSIDAVPVIATSHSWDTTAACGVLCQLRASTPEHTWTPFSNTTVYGAQHEVHYLRSGSLNGLRSVPVQTHGSQERRQDWDDQNLWIVAFYWEDGNEAAWNTWDTTQTAWAQTAVAAFVQGSNAAVLCVNFADDAGVLAVGVMTVGTGNNLAVAFAPGSLDADYLTCAVGPPNAVVYTNP